jgi:hypothetical protein
MNWPTWLWLLCSVLWIVIGFVYVIADKLVLGALVMFGGRSLWVAVIAFLVMAVLWPLPAFVINVARIVSATRRLGRKNT